MPQNSHDQEDIDLTSGLAAYKAKHFSRAMQLLDPYADAENSDALYCLAIMYQNGLGTVRNERSAHKFMLRAAAQNHALSHHALGFMYLEGDCVQKDEARAAQYFARGVEQGLVGSMLELAQLYDEGRGVQKNPEYARQLYRLAEST